MILVVLLIIASKSMLRCAIVIIIMQPTLNLFKLTGGINCWNACVYIMILLLFLKKIKSPSFPFQRGFLFVFISYAITYLLGEYNGLTSLSIFLDYAFLSILMWKLYEPHASNLRFVVLLGITYYSILALYGVYEALSFTHFFYDWVIKIGYPSPNLAQTDFGDGTRFGILRAYSFTYFNTYFANACGIGLIFVSLMMLYTKMYIVNVLLVIVYVFVMLTGVLVAGDRSALVMTSIFMLSLVPFIKNNKKWLLAILALIVCIYYRFEEYFDAIVYAFTHSDEVTGSNIDMRLSQLDAAIDEFWKSPIWGQGINAIGEIKEHNTGLKGGESYAFELLVNFGMLGILAFFFLFFNTICYLIKRKVFVLLPFFIGFILYNFMALPVHVYYIFPFLIILIKTIIETRDSNRTNIIHNKSF